MILGVLGVSVIIPAYNEEACLEATLQKVSAYFDRKSIPAEIIVVDDGSTDKTGDVVRAAQARDAKIIYQRNAVNKGKGKSLSEGIEHARYSLCLIMDADNATEIEEWSKVFEKINQGSRVVVASRHLPASRILTPQPFLRRFLGGGYRTLCRQWFSIQGSDFNCGFKAYETALAKEVYHDLSVADWTYDIEVFCRLKRLGVPHTEIPVSWRHWDKKSHRSPWVTACLSFRSLCLLKKKH